MSIIWHKSFPSWISEQKGSVSLTFQCIFKAFFIRRNHCSVLFVVLLLDLSFSNICALPNANENSWKWKTLCCAWCCVNMCDVEQFHTLRSLSVSVLVVIHSHLFIDFPFSGLMVILMCVQCSALLPPGCRLLCMCTPVPSTPQKILTCSSPRLRSR